MVVSEECDSCKSVEYAITRVLKWQMQMQEDLITKRAWGRKFFEMKGLAKIYWLHRMSTMRTVQCGLRENAKNSEAANIHVSKGNILRHDLHLKNRFVLIVYGEKITLRLTSSSHHPIQCTTACNAKPPDRDKGQQDIQEVPAFDAPNRPTYPTP